MALLEANKQIGPKAHSTLQGSKLHLHVKKDHKHGMFRAQWPLLEEKVKPIYCIIKAQISQMARKRCDGKNATMKSLQFISFSCS